MPSLLETQHPHKVLTQEPLSHTTVTPKTTPSCQSKLSMTKSMTQNWLSSGAEDAGFSFSSTDVGLTQGAVKTAQLSVSFL